MTFFPEKQGLYNPINEKDNCGVGFVANIKGQKSHHVITDGLEILKKLVHRGATGADPETGDGAGIMIQIPDKFLRKEMASREIELPPQGDYAVAMIFLPKEPNARYFCEGVLERIIEEEGISLIGWRMVPVNEMACGFSARGTCPIVHQLFVEKGDLSQEEFIRKLIIIRKRAEKEIWNSGKNYVESFYVCSFSNAIMVYKGQLLAHQIEEFYPELKDEDMVSAFATVHQRYSTNTFPSWNRAQPFRYLAHNGEINTLKGNVKWMEARQGQMTSSLFGDELKKIIPVVDEDGSDSQIVDNVLELLIASGRSMPHAMMMLIPEAWQENKHMDKNKKAFYEYHATLIEPWDGPAAMVFSNGKQIGATLDRNGLRPARYTVTKDGYVIMASEAGVLDIPPENILINDRLRPGRMFLVDLEKGEIISDDELKRELSEDKDYQQWLDSNRILLEDIEEKNVIATMDEDKLLQMQKVFNYTEEELKIIIAPMAEGGTEAFGSMGNDAPLSVLSEKPQLLFNYFKQLFAQVTNPPIDPIREKLVMSLTQFIGGHGNILEGLKEDEELPYIKIQHPVLTNEDTEKLFNIKDPKLAAIRISTLFEADRHAEGLQSALDRLCERVADNVEKGYNIIVLSDKDISKYRAPIPSLLALSAVHQCLIKKNLRSKVDLIVESGEARDVMHIALLLGYGAKAVNPYLAFETMKNMIKNKIYVYNTDEKVAVSNYIEAIKKGLLKIMSRMGISTLQSYSGAQIFEIVGLSEELADKYFTGTVSRIGGMDLACICRETLERHNSAFDRLRNVTKGLEYGGNIKWRKGAEHHAINPESLFKLQRSCRIGDYELFKEFEKLVDDQSSRQMTIRGLMKFKDRTPISIDEVEPVENILKRFATGAMSFGALSKEVHEAMAIAMNRIGGRSNSGEGGEDSARYVPDENGDLRMSKAKQVAAGRFGVTANYLVNADELQIKMAQGAKPGEGGHLPGGKVTKEIAKVRNSTPGIDLISPPPHHDIYSIEDLEQLIFDLKNVNPAARINVKLVSESGVGTVAAGVSKGSAEVVLISGHDGGTGASPISSIKYVGLPWEIGLSETQQTLLLNDLRSRIIVQVDGQMKTARDVVIGALLGAEEYAFGTTALVTLGCVMMRDCHTNKCPVGIATQDPELRRRFSGQPEHLINYFTFIANHVREIMAELGFRTIDEMIGRTDVLEKREDCENYKVQQINLDKILYRPQLPRRFECRKTKIQEYGLDKVLDNKLIDTARKSIDAGEKTTGEFEIKNTDRSAGVMMAGVIAKKYGDDGLPEDTVNFKFKGIAGQTFGGFLPKGVNFILEGAANDYLGKGISGGNITLYPDKKATFVPQDNIIAGNTLLYGGTGGKVFIQGIAGERFAVRNSGVEAVVEGVGDHGCEYMTGGTVVVLGKTGRNFGAGMSGGIAYVLDEDNTFSSKINFEIVQMDALDSEDTDKLLEMIKGHFEATGSLKAKEIIDNWSTMKDKFRRVASEQYLNIVKK
jgi:glutamate synthase (NADPH/NADH) large chain